jgi:hypothetical protein
MKPFQLCVPVFLAFSVLALGPYSASPAHAQTRVEGSNLIFEAETKLSPLKTGLEQLSFLGSFKGDDLNTWVIVSALSTLKDSGERAIFIMKADGRDRHEFVHPGRIVDPASGAKILESRAFFGKCRSDAAPGYFSYQIETVDKKRRGRRVRSTEPSVLMVETQASGLKESLKEIRSVATFRAREKETLRALKGGACTEVSGRNRVISRKMMSLTPKRDLGEPEEDEEEETPPVAATEQPPGSAPPKQLEPEKQDSAKQEPTLE